MRMLPDRDFTEQPLLTDLNCLQAHEFEQSQEHAYQRLSGFYPHQELLQPNGAIFERKAAVQVVNHLPHRYGLLVDIEHGTRPYSLQHLLKRLDQVDDVGGEFGFGTFGLDEFLQRRIGQQRFFDLLLLQKHLRRGFELLMLQQAVDQFGPRIILLLCACHRIARQEHLRFDMYQHGGHVDELGRNVHVEFANLLDIREILRGDLRNRDVVDIDVLLADEIEQQIQRSLVDIRDGNGEGEIALFFLCG